MLAGETALFEVVMRRYNQRLFRAARGVLRDEREAEDVVQDAWLRAYAHLGRFEGRAAFSTWVTRIAVNEAIARLRRRQRAADLDVEELLPAGGGRAGPEDATATGELRAALEAAIDGLPPAFRVVFMLREVEGLSTADTAASIEVPEETVKTRLHRARGLLRRELAARLGEEAPRVYSFAGERCDRIVAAVLARIGATSCTDRRPP